MPPKTIQTAEEVAAEVANRNIQRRQAPKEKSVTKLFSIRGAMKKNTSKEFHIADYDNLCCITCGEVFVVKGRLARHVQKWNAKASLREKRL